MRRERLDGERWRRLVAEHARSGLSLKAFAARKGVSVNSLAYWKYKRIGLSRRAPRDLVPVHVIDDLGSSGREFVLELGDARLRIPPDFDPAGLAGVLDLLRQPC